MKETIVNIIEIETRNILFHSAATGGDGFRQWFYPQLPKNYEINQEVTKEIYNGILQGKSAVEISREIIENHS